MNMLRKPGLLVVVICTFLVGFFIPWWFKPLPAPPLRIGTDTTHITTPLTSDGFVDFAAAIDQQLSKGIRPQDNAAVLIDRAFGPSAIDRDLRPKYLQAIGIEALPEKGDYVQFRTTLSKNHFEGLEDPGPAIEAWIAQTKQACQRPWSANSNPAADEWLNANLKPLELIVEASKLSQYYVPKVDFYLDTTSYNLKPAAELLVARAMRRLNDGDTAGAWSDLHAGHRLAALASHNCLTTTPFSLAVGAEGLVREGDSALIEAGMSVEQARQCIADLDRLPAMASIADLVDQGERFSSLVNVLSAVEEAKSPLDVNVMLKQVNEMFDELTTAYRQPEWQAQRQGLFQAIDKMEVRMAQRKRSNSGLLSRVLAPQQTASSVTADEMIGNFIFILTQQTILMHRRTQIQRDLVRLGYALAAFRAQNRAYPKTLEELVPTFLPSVPLDRFADKPLVYVPRENGFKIYSVGMNEQDDGGTTTGADYDITFEVPRPPDPAKSSDLDE